MDALEGLPPLFELLALLVVVYLVECVRTVAPRSLAVRSLFPGHWRLVRPFRPSQSWKRALVFGAPLPPLGAVFVADRLPFVVGPSGLTVWPGLAAGAQGWSVPPTDAVHVPWSEAARRVRVDLKEAELRVDGVTAAHFGSRRLAQRVAELLSDGDPQRFLDARFDEALIAERYRQWRRKGWPLVVACNGLFLAIAGGWWAVLQTGARVETVLLVAGIAWLACALNAWLTQRLLLPKSVRGPVGKRVINTLSPLALIRAADEVRAEVWGDFHPLAAAARAVPKRELTFALRDALAELEWPLQPALSTSHEGALADERWMRARQRSQLGALCAGLGVVAEALLHTPPEADGIEGAYCPRCRTEFTAEAAPQTCPECEGVPVRRFGGAHPAAAP